MTKGFVLILTIFFCKLSVAQTGICVSSGTVYDSDGLRITYCIEAAGSDGNCRKWKVNFSFSNSSKHKKVITNSQIHIINDVRFPVPVGGCGKDEGNVTIQFPWERKGIGASEMNPGYSSNSFIYVHSNNMTPKVEGSMVVKTNNATGEWSDWQNFSGCATGIEYRVKTIETYQLNYQVWMDFQVRNKYNKTIKYTFNLLDKNKKVQFNGTYETTPGQITEFRHKMDGLYIKSFSVDNPIFTDSKKSVCETTSESSSNPAGEDYQTLGNQLVDKKNDLCKEFRMTMDPTRPHPAYTSYCTQNTTYNPTKQDTDKLKTEIQELEDGLGKSGGGSNSGNNTQATRQAQEQENARQRQEEARQSQARQQQERFDNLIEQGDGAYRSKNYDGAMSYYSQAQSAAMNDYQRQTAQQKYSKAAEAKRTAAREKRLEEQKARDTKEDVAYTAAAATTLGVMAILKDAYTHKTSSGKWYMGLGLEKVPLITNQNNSYAPYASYADKTVHPSIVMGLNLEFMNNLPVNLRFGAGFGYGLEAFKTGISGGHVQFQIKAGTQFWYRTHTQFKLFADFEYGGRTGGLTIDQDAINNGTTSTDDVREGEYTYKYIKFGFGPMWHRRDDGKETWMRPGIYFERLPFTKGMPLIKSYSISANIQSFIILDFSYARNYPIAGTINYPNAFEFKNQHLFSIRVIRQGKIW